MRYALCWIKLLFLKYVEIKLLLLLKYLENALNGLYFLADLLRMLLRIEMNELIESMQILESIQLISLNRLRFSDIPLVDNIFKKYSTPFNF